MLLQSWSEAENIFLFVLNPTREKDKQIQQPSQFHKLLGTSALTVRSHNDLRCQGKAPPPRFGEWRVDPLASASKITQSPLWRTWIPFLWIFFPQANLLGSLIIPPPLTNLTILKPNFLPVTIRVCPFSIQTHSGFTPTWFLSEELQNTATTGNPWYLIFSDCPNSGFVHLVQANILSHLPILLHVSMGPGVYHEVRRWQRAGHLGFNLSSSCVTVQVPQSLFLNKVH